MHKPYCDRRVGVAVRTVGRLCMGTLTELLLTGLLFLSGAPVDSASGRVSETLLQVPAFPATSDWQALRTVVLDLPALPSGSQNETELLFSVSYLKPPGAKTAGPKLRVKPVERPQGLPLKASTHITSCFGKRTDPLAGTSEQFHGGIDFAGTPGTHVFATAAGRVVAAGWAGGYGQRIVIDHGHGIQTLYAHLNALDVRPDARVQYGQLIGRLGSTGRSTGPHLHYSVLRSEVLVDPHPFLALPREKCAKKARSRTCATLR